MEPALVLCWTTVLFTIVTAGQYGDEEAQQMARQAVVRFCVKEDFPFVECAYDDGVPITHGGTFGMGVVSWILNNPLKYGFSVYANCRVDHRKSKIAPPPLCTEENLVDPKKWRRLPTFIKVLQATAEGEEHLAYDKNYTAAEKESRKARAMARKGLGPEIYDLLDSKGKRMAIHDTAYVMQLLDGDMMWKIPQIISHLLRSVMHTLIPKMVDAYRMGGVSRFDQIASIFESEIYLRSRYTVSVMDVYLGFTFHMWSINVRHCDYHNGNIFYLKEFMPLDKDFIKMLYNGTILPRSMKDILFGSSLRELKRRYGNQVEVFRMSPKRIRVIDCAYAIDLNNFLQQGKTLNDIDSPCLHYTVQRFDDSHEIFRVMTWFDEIGSTLMKTYNEVKEMLSFAEMQEADSAFEERMTRLDSYISDLVTVMKVYQHAIGDNPSFQRCHVARETPPDDERYVGNCTMQVEMDALKLAASRLKDVRDTYIDLMPASLKTKSCSIYAPNFLQPFPDLPDIKGVRNGKPAWETEGCRPVRKKRRNDTDPFEYTEEQKEKTGKKRKKKSKKGKRPKSSGRDKSRPPAIKRRTRKGKKSRKQKKSPKDKIQEMRKRLNAKRYRKRQTPPKFFF